MADIVHLPTGPDANDELQGWVAIAAYLGRGVRTAQRWERLRGLPIHRSGLAGAEVVFASRVALDAWKAAHGIRGGVARQYRRGKSSQETGWSQTDAASAPHSSGTRREKAPRLTAWLRHPGVAVGSLAILTVLLIMWPTIRGTRRPAGAGDATASSSIRQLDHWRIDRRDLRVFDARDAELWSHTFEFPLDEAAYRDGLPVDGTTRSGILHDLDHDGRAELLIIPTATAPLDRRLYCFRPDGQIAFRAPIVRGVSFGGSEFGPPFGADQFVVTEDAAGKASIWVAASHTLRFPTVLQKLDASGNVQGEFWSNGSVSLLQPARVEGRPALLVGGSSAEQQAASLTVLDYDDPAGSAPAVTPPYRCDNCPRGQPLASLIFPVLDVASELTRRPRVDAVDIASDGKLAVSVLQAHVLFPGESAPIHASVTYVLTPNLRPVGVDVSDAYRQAHSELQLRGYLRHRFGPSDLAELLPLRTWKGGRFTPMN